MLDAPIDSNAKVEIVTVVDASSKDRGFFTPSNKIVVKDPVAEVGQAIIQGLENGFSLKVLFQVLHVAHLNVIKDQTLSKDEQKARIIQILDYIIDNTDTPYLPDYYFDPLFKSLVRPSVDVLFNVKKGSSRFSPETREGPITQMDLQAFVATMRSTYDDGFQWTDIAVYLESIVEFVLGYKNLSQEDQLNAAVAGVNMIIDTISVGPFSSTITQPLLKSFSRPLVMFVFSGLK